MEAYELHPYHIMIETFLLLMCVYIVLFKRSYNPKKKGFGALPPDQLTKDEIDELIEEWTPEPLLKPLPSNNALTTRKDVVVEQFLGGAKVRVRGVEEVITNFSSFDFLDLANDAAVKKQAIETLDTHGCGSCGPRGFYGTFDSHLNLEKGLSKFYGTAETIIYSDTVSTSSSVVPAFAKRGDLIVCDEGVAAPLLVGLRLSRAKVIYFKHNDVADLERVMKKVQSDRERKGRAPESRKRFLVVEGLYRDYGDFAPLEDILELKRKYCFRIVVDDSYGCFACGLASGRGILDVANQVPTQDVDIFVGSMATTLGSVGGFCTGTNEVVGHQRLSGAGYCFSASQPPFTATSALCALNLVSDEKTGGIRRQQLVKNATYLSKKLKNLSEFFSVGGSAESPITYIYLPTDAPRGDKERVLQRIAREVTERGYLVRRAIFRPMWNLSKKVRTPKAPEPSIRLLVSSAHTPRDIDELCNALLSAVKAVGASKTEDDGDVKTSGRQVTTPIASRVSRRRRTPKV